MGNLQHVAIYLAAAVLAVALMKRFGFAAVLGYLLAGIAIGPYGFALIDDATSARHLAEFGVVLLLFVIGLELQPSRLWALRRPIFGMGSAQVLLDPGHTQHALHYAKMFIRSVFVRGQCPQLTNSLKVVVSLASHNCH